MAIAKSARIHPTAVLDPEAELAAGVQVGPFVVIEGAVRLGAGCVVRPGAHLFGPMTIGENNVFHSHAIIGDVPQHLKYVPNPSSVVIGIPDVFDEMIAVGFISVSMRAKSCCLGSASSIIASQIQSHSASHSR